MITFFKSIANFFLVVFSKILSLWFLKTILIWFFFITETLSCILLILLILLQKGEDGGIGQVFMKTSILYNRSENLFIRKIIIFLTAYVLLGCLALSVYFFKTNKNKYQIENIIDDYSTKINLESTKNTKGVEQPSE